MEDDSIDKEVGRRLRAARQASGLSLQQLGQLIHVSGQQLSKYELGGNRISGSVLYRIAKALDLSIADLMPAIAPKDDHPQAAEFRVISNLRRLPSPVRATVGRLIEAIRLHLDPDSTSPRDA